MFQGLRAEEAAEAAQPRQKRAAQHEDLLVPGWDESEEKGG